MLLDLANCESARMRPIIAHRCELWLPMAIWGRMPLPPISIYERTRYERMKNVCVPSDLYRPLGASRPWGERRPRAPAPAPGTLSGFVRICARSTRRSRISICISNSETAAAEEGVHHGERILRLVHRYPAQASRESAAGRRLDRQRTLQPGDGARRRSLRQSVKRGF